MNLYFPLVVLIFIFLSGKQIKAEKAGCDLVEIRSVLRPTEDSEKRYVQSGAGWVIKRHLEDSQFFILTPAHVVYGADAVEVRCFKVVIKVAPVAVSPTLDLALFQVTDKVNILKPLWVYQDSFELNPNIEEKNYLKVIASPAEIMLYGITGHPYYFLTEVGKYRLIEQKEKYFLLGTKEIIFLTEAAIAPGISGSAIINSINEPYFPLGMLTKTSNNSNKSLAIPINTINNALTSLFEGKDPWLTQVDGKIHLDYKFNRSKDSFTRTRILTLHQESSSMILEEHSDSISFKSTSEWSSVAGGDWAEGGGNVWKVSELKPSNSSLDQNVFGVQRTSSSGDYSGIPKQTKDGQVISSFYKRIIYSSNSGVTFKGKNYIGIEDYDHKRFIKISAIEDIYGVVTEQGSATEAYLKKYGILDSSNSFSSFCREDIFGEKLYSKMSLPRYLSISEKWLRDGDEPPQLHVISHKLVPANPPFMSLFKENETISCSHNKKKIYIKKKAFKAVNYNLEITPHHISGTVEIGSCKVKINDKKDFWSYANVPDGKNPKKYTPIHFVVNIDPDQEETIFSISIIHLNSECIIAGNFLWFWQEEFHK